MSRTTGGLRSRSPLWALLAVATCLGVFQLGIFVGKRQRTPSLTDEIVGILGREYYKPVRLGLIQRASANGAIATLGDPYTRYLDPRDLVAARDDAAGAYSGVGIRLAPRDGALFVAEVFAKGPAARGGVKVGDHLLAIDGKTLVPGRSSGQIRGLPGTAVRLRLSTGTDKPRDITLRRERVTAPAVTGRIERRGGVAVGRLQLFEFTRGAGTELGLRTRELLRQGAKGLVLDLRGDPGGLVDEAVRSASVFLPKGTQIATTEGAHEPRRVLRARAGAVDQNVPLVLLVSRDSASSSEILAGALRDNKRATLVGTRTFGKAVIQATEVLDNGGALRFTIARYRTPGGFDINARGLIPSVAAEDNPATPADEGMERALDLATGVQPPAVAPSPSVTG